MSSKLKVHKSSGNVFADLGFEDAQLRLAKAEFARRIASTIRSRGLNQVDAAALLGIDQPNVSRLLNGRLEGFSLDRLFGFLLTLGIGIQIGLREPAAKARSASQLSKLVKVVSL